MDAEDGRSSRAGYRVGLGILLTLPWLATAGRIWARWIHVPRKIGSDDIATLMTLVVFSAFCGSILTVDIISNFAPTKDVDLQTLRLAVVMICAAGELYIVASATLKLALGLLFLRFLVDKWQRRLVIAIMVISTLYSLFFFFFALFICGTGFPQFTMRPEMAQCLRGSVIGPPSYIQAAINIISDWTFAGLPLFFVWNMNATRRTKIGIWFILALGSLGSLCTVIRIFWIHYLVVPTANVLPTLPGVVLVSTVELSIGLVCSCLATYRPLLRRFLRDSPQRSQQGTRETAETFVQSADPSLHETESRRSKSVVEGWQELHVQDVGHLCGDDAVKLSYKPEKTGGV